MGDNFGKIFGIGLAAAAVIVGLVFFAKRGDHLQPTVSILKQRTIDLNETTALLVLDIRIENDSDVTMKVDKINVEMVPASGEPIAGMLLRKSDLIGTFGYFPILGEKYNAALGAGDSIAVRSKTDHMIGATFQMPLAELDKRKKVKVSIQDASGAVAEFTTK